MDDVLLGATNQAGEDNRNVARMASLIAGLPESGIPEGSEVFAFTFSIVAPARGVKLELVNASVAVVDEEGQQLAESEPVRVYVLRPSINSPARRGNN